MKKTLRAFNGSGVDLFRSYIDSLRYNRTLEIPTEYLEDNSLTQSINGFAEVDSKWVFETRQEAGKYFCEVLDGVNPIEFGNDKMWAWLSLLYFDQICPANAHGERKPGKNYRYIPSNTYTEYYRHTLAGPFRLYQAHGEYAAALLSNPLHKVGDMNEQLASRTSIVGNGELMKSIHSMYYDASNEKYKRGCTTAKRAGSIRRLVAVKEQLDLTYDFFSMTCKEILSILPAEFNSWWMDAESA